MEVESKKYTAFLDIFHINYSLLRRKQPWKWLFVEAVVETAELPRKLPRKLSWK